MKELHADIVSRLKQVLKTARMWGSPAEFEAAVLHLAHVSLSLEEPGATVATTRARWARHFALSDDDVAEHARMRSRFWQTEEETARAQVVQGYVVLWAAAPRHSSREAALTPIIESLIDGPHQAGTPDTLNAALFTLMGFASPDLPKFAQLLAFERQRVGGHDLRPFHIVAAPGPSDAALPYMYQFKDWPRVIEAAQTFIAELPATTSAS